MRATRIRYGFKVDSPAGGGSGSEGAGPPTVRVDPSAGGGAGVEAWRGSATADVSVVAC